MTILKAIFLMLLIPSAFAQQFNENYFGTHLTLANNESLDSALFQKELKKLIKSNGIIQCKSPNVLSVVQSGIHEDDKGQIKLSYLLKHTEGGGMVFMDAELHFEDKAQLERAISVLQYKLHKMR